MRLRAIWYNKPIAKVLSPIKPGNIQRNDFIIIELLTLLHSFLKISFVKHERLIQVLTEEKQAFWSKLSYNLKITENNEKLVILTKHDPEEAEGNTKKGPFSSNHA